MPVKEANSSIELISGNDPGIEYYSIPDRDYEGDKEFITKYYIRQKLESHKKQTVTTLKISGVNSDEKLQIALITSDGYTYGAECENYEPGVYGIRFTDLKSVPTLILPHAYPVFLDKTFEPEISIPFDFNKVEYVQIHTGAPYNENLSEVWIE